MSEHGRFRWQEVCAPTHDFPVGNLIRRVNSGLHDLVEMCSSPTAPGLWCLRLLLLLLAVLLLAQRLLVNAVRAHGRGNNDGFWKRSLLRC